jgi:hypothetical protein
MQRFIARRGRLRWLAHLALSLGTLASFAITLPLVFGWLRFEGAGQDHYRVRLVGVPAGRFAIDGPLGWLAFHALSLAGVAVAVGVLYFLVVRLRGHRLPGAAAAFHVSPLVLLLVVALTGLALPLTHDRPTLFDAAASAHEASVVLLLVALPFSKLVHVLVRPLQMGARVLCAADVPPAHCDRCGASFAPLAQLAAVERLLAARGFCFDGHQRTCAGCRRRLVAVAQATLLGTAFDPRIRGAHPAPHPVRTESAA